METSFFEEHLKDCRFCSNKDMAPRTAQPVAMDTQQPDEVAGPSETVPIATAGTAWKHPKSGVKTISRISSTKIS